MVLKKSKSSPKPNKSPKNNKPAAPPLEPPDGLDEALAAVELLHEQTNEFDASVAPSRLLPEAARSCLDALGAREQQPKRVATLPVESTDELVERHAKLMEEKDARCADLLRAKYAMPSWRLNDVPIAMYFATHFYFCSYHVFANLALRKLRTRYAPCAARAALFVALVLAMAYAVAFMETLTISHFPYYDFEDRDMAYTVGSAFYGIYFIVSFPVHQLVGNAVHPV